MKRLGYVAGTLLAVLLGLILLSPLSTSTAHAQVTASHALTAPLSATTSNGDTFNGTFTVKRFVAQNGKILAIGTASGTLKNASGRIIRNVANVPLALPVTGGIPAVSPVMGAAPAAIGPCNVLNLVLGPLDLNLLGLLVHLNQVVLNITAVPVGLLGSLLCSLSGLAPGTPLTTIVGLLNQILAAL